MVSDPVTGYVDFSTHYVVEEADHYMAFYCNYRGMCVVIPTKETPPGSHVWTIRVPLRSGQPPPPLKNLRPVIMLYF